METQSEIRRVRTPGNGTRWCRKDDPPFELYRQFVSQEAANLNLKPSEIMSADILTKAHGYGRGYFISLARSRVFRRLVEMGFSRTAIGRTTGFSPCSVRFAAEKVERKEAKLFAMIDANLAHFGIDKEQASA